MFVFHDFNQVKNSMLAGNLMCIDYFHQGFTNFATIFEPYAKYCAEQVLCQNYCKDLNRNNALFTAYLAWCESQKECNRYNNEKSRFTDNEWLISFSTKKISRLRLADILVRPMQRLTKYKILMEAIRKHIFDETEAELVDVMVSIWNHCFLMLHITLLWNSKHETTF